MTLVEDFSDDGLPPPPSSAKILDNASHILDILAPVVASLQKITPRISNNMADLETILKDYDHVCESILQLLDGLRSKDRGSVKDDHDLEMTSLMLDALHKKVGKEQMSVHLIRQPINIKADYESMREESVAKRESEETKYMTSPLLLHSQNPFVLHSTSITLSSTRRSSVAGKGVPIELHGATAAPKDHLMPVQQTWAKNVIRLGSFQNSMLFSPSPVAVRPIATISPRHQPVQLQVD